MRILQINSRQELKKTMQKMKVDRHGIDIMGPKATGYLIKLNNMPNITANILKQEMLSLGGDCAIARDALTGKTKQTDCLLIGNEAQFKGLIGKLKIQPLGLNKLSQDLACVLNNYRREDFTLNLGRHTLNPARRRLIMGIVNLTPDSFSLDGLYGHSQITPGRARVAKIIDFVEKMVADGADIVDIGGESTRPKAEPVSVKEELARTEPVIRRLGKRIKVPISIDTYKPQVAKAALDAGASIVNDIAGLRNKKMVKVVAGYKCGVVIMHMKGRPKNMQDGPAYRSLMDEIIEYLDRSIRIALDAGIDKEKIIVDPGIGFGKTLEHNLTIIKSLRELKILGRPILAGVSRKSFIGKILNQPVERRLYGTLASCVLAALNGADILRVHDVKEVRQALLIAQAITGIR